MKYQVWVILEEWEEEDDGTLNNREEVETCLIGTVNSEDEGRQVFALAQDVSLAAKPHLEPIVEFEE